MTRINLTPKTEKILPVTIDGFDYDISIDTRDIALTSLILSMADDCVKLEYEIEKIKDTKDLEQMRIIANKALAKTDEFYAEICSVIPMFNSCTHGQPIRDFRVWTVLLYTLAELVSEGKASASVAKTLEEESSNVIGAV